MHKFTNYESCDQVLHLLMQSSCCMEITNGVAFRKIIEDIHYTHGAESFFSIDSSSTCQEICLILFNVKVCYFVCKRPQPDLVLLQTNSLHVTTRYSFNFYSYIILPSKPRSSRLPFKFYVYVSHLSSMCNVPYRVLRPRFGHLNNTRI